jgi:tetratricopeptide (TPR) repeat protein
MKKGMRLIGMSAALLALAVFAAGQTAQEHIQKGDEYYAQFDDQKALEEYRQAVALEPANYEALWKCARGIVDTADLLDPKEKDVQEKQKKMYGEAESLAKKAIAVNPNDTWGHFTLSAAMGKRLLLLGKKEQIDASRKVKGVIEKAIELDPTNDLAYHALGRWHRRIAEIGGAKRFFGSLIYGSIPKGSFEESAKFLEKAVELRPAYINHHYELGLTYLALEKKDQAAAEFQKCLDLPKSSSKDDMIKGWAEAELKKLKKG